jgi:hypothetical protein
MMHRIVLGLSAQRGWVAIRMADGSSDGTLYDTKRDAVRHQSYEQECLYVSIPPGGMSQCSAETLLQLHRKLYRAGMRLADPDARSGGPQLIRPLMVEESRRMLSALRR